MEHGAVPRLLMYYVISTTLFSESESELSYAEVQEDESKPYDPALVSERVNGDIIRGSPATRVNKEKQRAVVTNEEEYTEETIATVTGTPELTDGQSAYSPPSQLFSPYTETK